MRKQLWPLFLFSTACSNSAVVSDASSVDAASSFDARVAMAPDAAFVPLAPPDVGVQLHYGPANYDDPSEVAKYTLAPGDESVTCVVAEQDHPAMNVAAYEVSERAGMHHFSLFTGVANAPAAKDMCTLGTTAVFLVQRPHEKTAIGHGAPEYADAALSVAAGSFVIQAHAINTSNSPELVEAWVNLETVDSTKTPVTWLSLSAGHVMAVPPHTKQTITATAKEFNVGNILQLVGHFHAHTTEERVTFNGSEVYRSDSWAEPDVAWYTSVDRAPLVVPIGGSLSWECDVNNTTDATLRFANQALTAEMCNLVGFVMGTKPWAASLP